MVRRADGKDGWVLSRFLTSKKPNRMILEGLIKKNKVLVDQNESLLREHSELKEKSKELEVGFADKQKELQKAVDAYETLKRESAEFLKLKSSYAKSKKNQNDMVKKTGKMEEELNYLRTQHIFKWFLVGAGVLLLGFIIGFSARRSRRRPSLL
jgi:SH3 domain protein